MVSLLIALVVAGALLYIFRLLPLDETIKQIGTVLVIVFLAIYVIKNLGALGL